MRSEPVAGPQGPTGPKRSRHVVDSFRFASRGLVFALRSQRNLRIHFFIALLVLLLAVALPVSRVELALLVLTISGVLVAELVNTAVEVTVDLGSPGLHELARAAKDVAAGAVLVAALAATCVGLLIFYRPLTALLTYEALPGSSSVAHVTLAGACLVLLVTWGAKTLLTRPVRLTGGMPSGHAAVAFALATAVFFISGNGLLTLLAVVLAGLVGQSRLEGGMHSLPEVAAGGALGVLVMAALFWWFG